MPKLRIILDHFGNIRLDGKAIDPGWMADFRAAAKHPNVYCKVSALYGRVEKQPAPKDITPLVIRFTANIDGKNFYRFAQNRSKTFDSSVTVCKREDARVFVNREAAFCFLAKLGLVRKDASGEYSKVTNLDSALNYWQFLNVD